MSGIPRTKAGLDIIEKKLKSNDGYSSCLKIVIAYWLPVGHSALLISNEMLYIVKKEFSIKQTSIGIREPNLRNQCELLGSQVVIPQIFAHTKMGFKLHAQFLLPSNLPFAFIVYLSGSLLIYRPTATATVKVLAYILFWKK